jgi:hypothetical protein
MRFAWPTPGVVLVSESISKKGLEAQTAYELHMCKAERGLHIHYRNFRFVSVGGVPADDERVREMVQQALPISGAIPTLWIGTDGAIIDLVDYDRVIDAALAKIADSGLRKRVTAVMHTPRFADMVKAKSLDIWQSWVGAWLAFEPNGEAKQQFTLTDGSSDRNHTIERSAVEGDRLRLRLSKHEGDAELEGATQLLRSAMESMLSPEHAKDVLAHATFERTTTWDALIEPRTARPIEVTTSQQLMLHLPDAPTRSRDETHHYRFDWKAGAKKTPRCDGS